MIEFRIVIEEMENEKIGIGFELPNVLNGITVTELKIYTEIVPLMKKVITEVRKAMDKRQSNTLMRSDQERIWNELFKDINGLDEL